MKTFRQWLVDNNMTIIEASRRTGVHRHSLAKLDTGKPKHKQVLAAVERLTAGELDMSQYKLSGRANPDNPHNLSVSQLKAAQLYSDGWTTAQMQAYLHKSAGGVGCLLDEVLRKVGGNNRRHAAAILRKEGVIT